VSRIGSAAEQQAAIEGFQHAAGFIRSQLGKRLKLRYVPQLDFQLDTSIAYGVRISSLLHDLLPTETQTKPQDEGEEENPPQT
jgi:ribosome-binding factor A